MSLEEALLSNTAAVTKNNELLEKLLGASAAAASKAVASGGSSEDTEEKKPRGRKPKDDDSGKTEEPKAVTLDDVKPIISKWLTEFPKNGDDDHPEAAARKAAFKGALDKLGATNLTTVPADKLGKIKDWAEAQIAKGRLVPDEPEGSEDDDMLG